MKTFILRLLTTSLALGSFSVLPHACTGESGTNWSSRKTTFEPDSVRGDTLYYSYVIKTPNAAHDSFTSRMASFRTAAGRWCLYDLAYGWVPLARGLVLYCDRATFSRKAVEKFIRDNGHTVYFYSDTLYWKYIVYQVYITSRELDYTPSSVPFLDILAAYDARTDIFVGIYAIKEIMVYW